MQKSPLLLVLILNTSLSSCLYAGQDHMFTPSSPYSSQDNCATSEELDNTNTFLKEFEEQLKALRTAVDSLCETEPHFIKWHKDFTNCIVQYILCYTQYSSENTVLEGVRQRVRELCQEINSSDFNVPTIAGILNMKKIWVAALVAKALDSQDETIQRTAQSESEEDRTMFNQIVLEILDIVDTAL